VATRGLVTDVGNDILYGFSAERTLEWVEEAVRRLNRVTRDVIVTDLPLDRIRRLSNAKFLRCFVRFWCRRAGYRSHRCSAGPNG
jgi:hypothetical protein